MVSVALAAALLVAEVGEVDGVRLGAGAVVVVVVVVERLAQREGPKS